MRKIDYTMSLRELIKFYSSLKKKGSIQKHGSASDRLNYLEERYYGKAKRGL